MFDFDDPKNWSALIIGLLLVALGVIPILSDFGLIGFGLGFLTGIIPSIAAYLLAAGGIYLLIDSFMEDDHMRIVSIIVSLLVIAVGIIVILNKFEVIGWTIPFISPLVYYILFVIEGIFLVLAAFLMF